MQNKGISEKKTTDFSGKPDYELALSKPQDIIYFGSGKIDDEVKKGREDLKKLEHNSLYYGKVLFPEVTLGSKRKWDENINQEFWAGGIDAKRPFLLISDINDKGFVKNQGMSMAELMWLADNKYIFVTDPINLSHTWALPNPNNTSPTIIKDYYSLKTGNASEKKRWQTYCTNIVTAVRSNRLNNQNSTNTLLLNANNLETSKAAYHGFNSACIQDPQNPEHAYNFGCCILKVPQEILGNDKKEAQAEIFFTKAFNLIENNTSAPILQKINLLEKLRKQCHNLPLYKLAFLCSKLSSTYQPEISMHFHNMGFYEFKQGNHSEALKHYAKSLELAPLDKKILIMKKQIDVHLAMSNPEEAKKVCENAIKIDPNDKELKPLLEKIQSKLDTKLKLN